jgi:GxxExxY protein
MFIGDSVIVELKSVEKVTDTHRAQLLTYLKLAEIRVGLLINFNVRLLKDGLDRFVI